MGQLPNVGIECGHSNSLLVFTVLSRAGSSGTLRHMVHCGAEYRVPNPISLRTCPQTGPRFHIESKQIMTRKRDLICMTTSTVS